MDDSILTIQQVQFFDKYSRYSHSTGTHESFGAACDRSVDFFADIFKKEVSREVFADLRVSMHSMDAFPGMRLYSNAGASALRDPESIFNCSYLPITDLMSFKETMRLLGLGVGVGYSVEHQYVSRLPMLAGSRDQGYAKTIVVEDSLYGWTNALYEYLKALFANQKVDVDYSYVRPAGAPLHVRGGFASGPEPLIQCFENIRTIIEARRPERFLRTIDAHDIQCSIASAIVSGGVRRAAMISLFSENDNLMWNAKSGNWYEKHLYRRFANNSVVITGPWQKSQFDHYFETMVDSRSGEPGIFSRYAANITKPARRAYAEFGTNACGEIALNPWQFCNLSIANVRYTDSTADLKEKVRLAAIWGTMQAAYLTKVNHTAQLRPQWYINQVNERLLGVDLNGLRDNPMLNEMFDRRDGTLLKELKMVVLETNQEFAKLLGIAPAAAATCDKPAGNSATLFNTASGAGPRYAPYYTRRMRLSSTGRVAKLLALHGMPFNPEVGQDLATANTLVFDFPVKAPEGAVYASDLTGIDQLEFWRWCKTEWTEHNPSTTIYFNPDEVDAMSDWTYNNQNLLGGVSFLPRDNTVYALSPYEVITPEKYEEDAAKLPYIDWTLLDTIGGDISTSAQEFACVGGACEVV